MKRFLVGVLAAISLGGCAVYASPPPPPAPGVYVAPGPVVVAPVPFWWHWGWRGGGWRRAGRWR